nr:LysM peptidoglycan-binding domain-containing protein [uncultured Treponema sp.]
MKTIGIKLADGSFYPIMQEGSAEKKQLSLTTVKDNQTTVQVDLYRSESGTMEDAEYVDTLEIKHLKKHPNGEPDFSLAISLDENNELKAELHDPETGKASSSDVTLVLKPQEDLDQPSDITLAELDESLSNPQVQESFDSDEDLSFDPNSLNVDSIVEEEASESTEPVMDDLDFSAEDFSIPEESENSDSAKTAAIATGTGLLGAATAMALAHKDDDSEEPVSEELAMDEPLVEESFDVSEPAIDEPAEDTFDVSEPAMDEPAEDTFGVSEPSMDEPAEDIFEVPETTETSETDTSDFNMDDFSIPDENEDSYEIPEEGVEASDFNIDDFSIPDDFDSNDTFATEESLSTNDAFTEETSEETFDIPETEETSDSEISDDLFNDFDETDSMAATTASSGLDFSDILDEETKEGHASESSDTETIRKKTKTPVIICIICAIICILAVILTLFVIPSKFNLVNNCAANTEEASVKPAEKETEKPNYDAKENEIVVAPAEEIVPEVPKKPAPESKNITYKIKWGDTLWDISKTYYKNPWKYHKIAKFNGIKNPDHIISGTKIVIPAE